MNTNYLNQDELTAIKELTAELRRGIPDVLLSCAETARIIGVTPNTISGYIRQHRMTKRTIGKVTGIPLRDVLTFDKKKKPA